MTIRASWMVFFALILVATATTVMAQDKESQDRDSAVFKEIGPFVSLAAGTTEFQRFGMSASNRDLSLQLGYEYSHIRSSSGIEVRTRRGLLFNYEQSNRPIGGDANIDVFQFGITNDDLYPVTSKESATSLYLISSGAPLLWSIISLQDSNATPPALVHLNDFGSDVRFGHGFGAGVEARISNTIGFKVSADVSQIYPRTLFLQATVSGMIEGISQAAMDTFLYRIGRNSPKAYPYMAFILKNALSYGFYALRRDNMTWPFSSADPMNVITYRLSMSYVF